MIRFMLLVVLASYNMEKGPEEGQNLGQTSSWEADVGNQGKESAQGDSHGEGERLITER